MKLSQPLGTMSMSALPRLSLGDIRLPDSLHKSIAAYARHGRHWSAKSIACAGDTVVSRPARLRLSAGSLEGNASGSPNARMAM